MTGFSEFDLSASSQRRYRFDAPGRWFSLAVGWGFVGLWLLLLPALLRRISLDFSAANYADLGVQLGFLAVGPLLGGYFTYLVFFRMRRGPTKLTVTPEGLEFGYLSGATRYLSWTDPRIRLVIRDDRHNPNVDSLLAIDLKLRGLGPVPISVDASQAVIREAKSMGLRVNELPQGSAGDEFDRLRGSKITRISAR
jgi:hypothetical protein